GSAGVKNGASKTDDLVASAARAARRAARGEYDQVHAGEIDVGEDLMDVEVAVGPVVFGEGDPAEERMLSIVRSMGSDMDEIVMPAQAIQQALRCFTSQLRRRAERLGDCRRLALRSGKAVLRRGGGITDHERAAVHRRFLFAQKSQCAGARTVRDGVVLQNIPSRLRIAQSNERYVMKRTVRNENEARIVNSIPQRREEEVVHLLGGCRFGTLAVLRLHRTRHPAAAVELRGPANGSLQLRRGGRQR